MDRKREYSYDDRKKPMDLHSRYKLGPTKISRVLGISKGTVNSWLYYGVMPPAAKWTAKPYNELGYVIEMLYNGDGNVCKSKDNHTYYYVIQLDTIDKEFAETFSIY